MGVKARCFMWAAALLLLGGCGEHSAFAPPAASLPEGIPGTVSAPSPNSGQMSGTSPIADKKQEQDAQDAFLKTYAAGTKSLILKNIVVQYIKTSDFPKQVLEKWTGNCSLKEPVILEGKNLIMTSRIGEFDCGAAHKTKMFTSLRFLAGNLRYRADYIPAFPSEPNQFRLSYLSGVSSYFKWVSIGSLNALTKDHTIFMDLTGEEKKDILDPDSAGAYHYVTISFDQNTENKPNKFILSYSLRNNAKREETQLSMTADY